jgi:hypothetical protein
MDKWNTAKGLVACNQHGRNINKQSHHTHQLAEMCGSSLGRRCPDASLRYRRVRV